MSLDELPISRWREPLRATLLRTVTIALAVGFVWALASRGGLARWPATTLLALWPALGGHFVELFYLNRLRPRLRASRAMHVAVRLAVWCVGGMLLAGGMVLTARLLTVIHPPGGGIRLGRWSPWRIVGVGGAVFVGIELVVHDILRLRGRACLYDGRG